MNRIAERWFGETEVFSNRGGDGNRPVEGDLRQPGRFRVMRISRSIDDRVHGQDGSQ